MDLQDCIKFANKNNACAIATLEGDQPRVRFVEVWRADNTGFYFQTESPKAFYKQLKRNPNVEVCFVIPKAFQHDAASDPTEKMTMRLTGKVEFLDDKAIKAACLKARPFLKEAGIETPDDPRLILFRIPKGEIFFWSLANTCRESDIPRIRF